MLTVWHHIFSMRIDRTVRIARRQAQVSEQALRSVEEGGGILWMDLVVPAHLDGKPAFGVQHELPRRAQMHGVGLFPLTVATNLPTAGKVRH